MGAQTHLRILSYHVHTSSNGLEMVINCGEITLNNGIKMPKFGLGTWLSKPGEVKTAVECAIDNGYRHIDGAFCYENENEVGAAIKVKIDAGVVKREELFYTSKLWNTFHRPEDVETQVDMILKDTGLDYIDLLLIHWPCSFKLDKDNLENRFPKNDNGLIIDDEAHYLQTWLALEKLYKGTKKVRAIGVSNFNAIQIKVILDNGTVVPAMNQYEGHPFLQENELLALCHSKNIHVTAYSPLGNPGRPAGLQVGQEVLMENPVVVAAANKHKKSVAQVLIRWGIQRGIVMIPKSVTPARIVANSEIFDFELDAEDMAEFAKLDKERACRYVIAGPFKASKYYPFTFPYEGQ